MWKENEDVALMKEVLDANPFKYKEGTVNRGKCWEQIADKLTSIKKSLTNRSVRERYCLLKRKFQIRMRTEEKQSGMEADFSELDGLIQDVIEFEKFQNDEKEKVGKEVEKKHKQAEGTRKRAMERMSETEEREGKKIRGRDSTALTTVKYLQEKNEISAKLQEKELEIRKMELEQRKKDSDTLQQCMLQQQQDMRKQQIEFQKVLLEMQKQQTDLLKMVLSKK